MSMYLTNEEIRMWRSSTEKITLEAFARKLGKALNEKKETKDLHDIILSQPIVQEEPVPVLKFKKLLTKREEIVFNYFCKNKGKKVYVRDLSRVLNIPNDYVYKYIKCLREKMDPDILHNAEGGGYIIDPKYINH